MKPTWNKFTVAASVLCVLLGTFFGLGIYTFIYAKGFSYLSTAPEACANCHVMKAHYDDWQKSSHHHVAVCVSCHLPREVIPKYWTKAENGFVHSAAFTLQNFHEPIMLRHVSRRIVNNACLNCHAAVVGQLAHQAASKKEGVDCTSCHSEVGH